MFRSSVTQAILQVLESLLCRYRTFLPSKRVPLGNLGLNEDSGPILYQEVTTGGLVFQLEKEGVWTWGFRLLHPQAV